MPYEDSQIVGYLRQAHDTPLLTEREKHLIGLAVTLTRGCQVCTRGRIEKARAAGIADDVLNALVNVTSSVNAGVSAATGREGIPHGRCGRGPGIMRRSLQRGRETSLSRMTRM